MPERRTWLIGENNPYSADPRHALYPHPPGSAGARLCSILGMRERDYLLAFARRNLLSQPKWSVPAARKAAHAVLALCGEGDRLVLLGARVAAAFGYPFAILAEHDGLGAHDATLRVLLLPHPSGLSRAWNEPGMVERVREAVAQFRCAEPTTPLTYACFAGARSVT